MADSAPLPDDDDASASRAGQSRETVHAEALERWSLAESYYGGWAQRALKDIQFTSGGLWQWDAAQRGKRDAQGRPSLTINRVLQLLLQVTNDVRQNRPAILVSPVSEGADEVVAEVWQGLIRHIEYDSDAEAAYDTAVWNAACPGLGYLRVTAEYASPESMEQVLKIGRVRNPFAVVLDPAAQEPDGSDAQWAFVVSDVSKEAFLAQYPDATRSVLYNTAGQWAVAGHTAPDWVREDGLRVADYYAIEYTPATVYQVADPETGAVTTVTATEPPPVVFHPLTGEWKSPVVIGPDGKPAQRKTQTAVVKHYQMTAEEIVAETVWPGRYIPIARVPGLELDVDGAVDYVGLIRNARDAQMAYNYATSAAIEAVALAPKAPFVGYEGQFENEKWGALATTSPAALETTPMPVGWKDAWGPAPLPQRNVQEPAIQAIMQVLAHASDDLKAVTGIYDASLGNRSNETSGVAIQRRAAQGQTATYHFADNLKRGQRHIGRIILDAGPQVYTTPRVLRLIGEDESPSTVQVNQPGAVYKGQAREQGIDLTTGKYDAVISTGPTYQTRRQEAAETLMQLMRTLQPQQSAAIADLAVRATDIPYAPEAAERLKAMLPPNVANPGAQPLDQQAQRQIEQLQQQVQEAQSGDALKMAELASKERIAAADRESREKIAAWQTEASLLNADTAASTKTTLDLVQHEMDMARRMAEQMHDEGSGEAAALPSAPPQGQPMPAAAGGMMR